MKQIIFLLLVVLSLDAVAQRDANMGIIPAPVSVKKGHGDFDLTSETIIMTDSPNHKAVRFFADFLRKKGFRPGITDMSMLDERRRNVKNAITLQVNFDGDLPSEGYELNVNADRVLVRGRYAGLFYGVQTLIQLIETKSNGTATIPSVSIKDYPRFTYRGCILMYRAIFLMSIL